MYLCKPLDFGDPTQLSTNQYIKIKQITRAPQNRWVFSIWSGIEIFNRKKTEKEGKIVDFSEIWKKKSALQNDL